MTLGGTNPSSYERLDQSHRGENSNRSATDKAFLSFLTQSICESLVDILGRGALTILVAKGLLDDASNPNVLVKQLSETFGRGSFVLERIIVKTLYRKLGIPFDSGDVDFDYSKALEGARAAFVEVRKRDNHDWWERKEGSDPGRRATAH